MDTASAADAPTHPELTSAFQKAVDRLIEMGYRVMTSLRYGRSGEDAYLMFGPNNSTLVVLRVRRTDADDSFDIYTQAAPSADDVFAAVERYTRTGSPTPEEVPPAELTARIRALGGQRDPSPYAASSSS